MKVIYFLVTWAFIRLTPRRAWKSWKRFASSTRGWKYFNSLKHGKGHRHLLRFIFTNALYLECKLESFPNAATTQSYVLFISTAGPLGALWIWGGRDSSKLLSHEGTIQFFHFGGRQTTYPPPWQQENSIPASSEQYPKCDEAASEGSRGLDGCGWGSFLHIWTFCPSPNCALNAGRGRRRSRDFPSLPACCKTSPGNPHKQGKSLKTFQQLSHQAQENKSQLPKDCHEASN